MKKFLSLLLVAAMVFSLAACKSNAETTPDVKDDDKTVTDAQQTQILREQIMHLYLRGKK